MEIQMTIENPVWGTADTGVVHVVEAPPAGYAFYPTAACGTADITGERLSKSDFPRGTDFCSSCETLTNTGSKTEKKEGDK